MELRDRIEEHTRALMPILDDENFNRFEKIKLINQSIKEFVEQSQETGQVDAGVSVRNLKKVKAEIKNRIEFDYKILGESNIEDDFVIKSLSAIIDYLIAKEAH